MKSRFASGVLLLLLCLAPGCSRPPAEIADLVVRNARIYTVDEAQPWAQAVAVKGERILWVGLDAEAGRFASDQTRVIDAGGRLLLPGFIDSHNHIRTGSDPDLVRLFDARTLKEIQDRVRAFARSRPDLTWIEGEGWNYSAMPGGRLPTAADLEGLTDGRPAFLIAYDSHTVWLNRSALKQLGITRRTARLPYGEVFKNPRTGEPTSILNEFATLGLSKEGERSLEKFLPSRSEEHLYASFKESLAAAIRFGITTIVEPQAFLEDLPMYEKILEDGALRSRLQIALFHPRGTPEADLGKFEEARRRLNDDRLRVAAIKLYIDDVIEPHTAAMLEPYADAPGGRGDTLYPPAEFNGVVARLDRLSFQILIHAIGDRGIRTALDALGHARQANGPRDSRHQLVHIECISPQDIPRFNDLGVVACMQPRHCAPDISGKWAASVGPERSKYAWAFRSLKEAGARLAFASDWNVAEMDPLIGIYTARTRKGLDGNPPGGWIPEQTVDLDTAIRAYTLNGAWASFAEGNRGSVTAGKYADLILLSDDLFEIPPEKIKDARVVLTLVGGKEEYRAF